MKNYFYSSLIALLCVFTSCSKSDDNGQEPGTGDGGYVSGSYWPFALHNSWYLVNADEAEKSDYLIHKTLTHEGKTYFQFKPIGTDADVELTDGFREDNGLFTALHGATSIMGVNTSAGTISYINTNLNVGEVWKDELTLTISGLASGTIKHSNEGKIIEKADQVTINGKTYRDVLKTELKTTITNSQTAYNLKATYEIWLAEGIGIIYEKTTFGNEPGVSYGLVAYSVN